jgi:hypothetical protein
LEAPASTEAKARRNSEAPVPAEARPEDENARKEWRRQATAVINNSKFHRSIVRLLAIFEVSQNKKRLQL